MRGGLQFLNVSLSHKENFHAAFPSSNNFGIRCVDRTCAKIGVPCRSRTHSWIECSVFTNGTKRRFKNGGSGIARKHPLVKFSKARTCFAKMQDKLAFVWGLFVARCQLLCDASEIWWKSFVVLFTTFPTDWQRECIPQDA